MKKSKVNNSIIKYKGQQVGAENVGAFENIVGEIFEKESKGCYKRIISGLLELAGLNDDNLNSQSLKKLKQIVVDQPIKKEIQSRMAEAKASLEAVKQLNKELGKKTKSISLTV